MIPRTFPSSFASNGQQQMQVYFLSDVTGLQRWIDYIPVKLSQNGAENTYDLNGFIDVEVVGKSLLSTPFKDYVPVYVDPTATEAWMVNVTGYIPYGYAGTGDASLVLDFTNSSFLDPRITFTRSTTATYFNSAGVLTVTGFNLLTYSRDFSTNWTKGTAATWTSNAATAPDGTMTALQGTGVALTTATGTSGTLFQTGVTISGSTSYTFSVYVRAQTDTVTNVRLRLNDGTTTTLSSNLTVTTEWTRLSLTATSGAGATAMSVLVGTSGTPANLYIWGAQLQTGSTATAYIPTVASTSGAPRFDYDPVTLAPKGLLIEESRTNLLTYSEQFDNAAWNKTLGTVTVTVTADATTSPDGTVDADKVITANATGDHVIAQVASVTSGTTYTKSWFLKAAELNWVQVTESTGFGSTQFQNINLSNGTVGNGNYGSAISVTSVGNGWYRVSVTDTATATSASGRFLLALLTSDVAARLTDVIGNGTSGIYIWGAQLEAGAFATSYIPTVASQVTRSNDVAVVTGTNFSSWYNATEGTLFGQADWLGLSNNDYFFAINNGATTNLIALGVSATPVTRFIVSDGGVTQASINGPTPVANTAFKIAGAYQANNFAAATNGTLGTVDTSGTVPTGMSEVSLTSSYGSANLFNGHIQRIAYYNRRLSNTELAGITA